MPDREPPAHDQSDMPNAAVPHMNGAVTTTGFTKARKIRRRLFLAGLVVFLGAWAIALTYSVTAGGRSPERLDDANAHAVAEACLGAQRQLAALPQVSQQAIPVDRAVRIVSEDKILTTMIAEIRRIHPTQKTPAIALTDWTDDWTRLVASRDHYVSDLHTKGIAARWVEPATAGVDPISDKMNNWTLEQGTRTDACNTGELQAEVISGPRVYGLASKS